MATRFPWLGVAVLAVALVTPVPVAGQQLQNTTFDTTVGGWVALSDSTLSWDALDAISAPDSGSALVENDAPNANNATGAVQCVDAVIPGDPYEFGASVYLPSGQSETGSVYLLVQWYAAVCGADQVGLDGSAHVSSSSPDQWLPTYARVTAPATAHAARVRLSIWKNETGGALRAHFDNVTFTSLALLKDGFEDGTLNGWSFVQP